MTTGKMGFDQSTKPKIGDIQTVYNIYDDQAKTSKIISIDSCKKKNNYDPQTESYFSTFVGVAIIEFI